MSLYNVLVFLHLAAAFFLVGGLTVQRLGLMLIRSSSHGAEALGAFRTYSVSPKLIAPSGALTVVTGLVLAWHIGYSWRALWVAASVVLLVALEIWRAVVVVPLVKRLQAAAAQAATDPAAHGAALMEAARQPRFHWGYLGIELTNTVILALMVFKPMAL
jgi:uncharacterized membrane protein